MNIDLSDAKGVDLMKLKTDVSKFVLKQLASDKYGDNKDKAPAQVQVNLIQYGNAPQIREGETAPDLLQGNEREAIEAESEAPENVE